MSALNFNPAPSYVVFLAMALKKKGTGVMIQSPSVFESLGMWYIFLEYKMFYSLPSFSTGNFDSQVDPLSDLFPEIPSPFVESVNSISEESFPADPTFYKPPTADPTFGESPLSAPAANPVNTTALEPRHSHRVSTFPSHLRDFHCFSIFATLHEPHTFREASFDLLWQQVMKEELNALLKTGT